MSDTVYDFYFPWFGNVFSLSVSVSLSLSLSYENMSVRRLITIGKGLTTPDCFALYLVKVATKEYCSICLKTAFYLKNLAVAVTSLRH